MKLKMQLFTTTNNNGPYRKSTSPKRHRAHKKNNYRKRHRKQQGSTSPKQQKDFQLSNLNPFQKQTLPLYSLAPSEIQPNVMATKLVKEMLIHEKGPTVKKTSVENATKKQYSPFPSRPAKFHPDDDFFSGAWLFDANQTPQWLKRELKKNPIQTPSFKPMIPNSKVVKVSNLTEDEMVFETSGAWLFRFKDMPKWFQEEVKKDVKVPSKKSISNSQKNNPTSFKSMQKDTTPFKPKTGFTLDKNNTNNNEDGFYSGAWLFDLSCAPHWFQSCLFSSTTLVSSPTKPLSSIHSYQNVLKPSTPSSQIQKVNLKAQQQTSRGMDMSIGIESGAWLFDLTMAPTWFQLLIRNTKFESKPKVIRKLSGFSYHTFTQQKYDQFVSLNPVPVPSLSSPLLNQEIGFFSGAWLFDQEVIPEWMQKECFSIFSNPSKVKPTHKEPNPKQTSKNKSMKTKSNVFKFVKPLVVDEEYGFMNGGWLFDGSMAPVWLKEALRSTKVFPSKFHSNQFHQPTSTFPPNLSTTKIRNVPIQLSDIDFYTGAWLFDQQRVPSWLKKEMKFQPSFNVGPFNPKFTTRKHGKGI